MTSFAPVPAKWSRFPHENGENCSRLLDPTGRPPWRVPDPGVPRIAEIEAAIEHLSAQQVEELAIWLDSHRARRAEPVAADAWLTRHGEPRVQG